MQKNQKYIYEYTNNYGKNNGSKFRVGHSEYQQNSNPNVVVWEDTVKAFTTGRFSHFPHPKKSEVIRNLRNLGNLGHLGQSRNDDTIISVENTTSLDMAQTLVKNGCNPLVLNMASNYRPGGGVRKGSKAQEEDLFRKTNYFMTLDTHNLPKDTYPLKGQTMIYSSNVTVVKNGDYNDLSEPFQVSLLACPAVRNPKQTKNKNNEWDYQRVSDRYLMEQRIRRIYEIGHYKNHDTLVLGALGCGAFHNPTLQVAKMFKKVNEEFKGVFKYIGFPVLSPPGNPNYDIFRAVLSGDHAI